jgi:hypothetical protein
MVTMAAGKTPRVGEDSLLNRLGPSRTQTFHTRVGCQAWGLFTLGKTD